MEKVVPLYAVLAFGEDVVGCRPLELEVRELNDSVLLRDDNGLDMSTLSRLAVSTAFIS